MEAPQRDFHHPYKPYDVQYDLMNAIYECIADEKIGIFESPTGTFLLYGEISHVSKYITRDCKPTRLMKLSTVYHIDSTFI